jgi:opacity protein-like surface antigen
MSTMTKLALAAALVLGAASAVQANDIDRNDRGGFRVGPMGQHFGGANPAYHRSMRYGDDAYAYVPGYRVPYNHHRTWGWDWNR